MISWFFLRILEAQDRKLEQLLAQGNKIMSAIDDLNQAVIDLTTAISAGVDQINTELATILNAVNEDPAIESAVGNIKTVAQGLNDAVAAAQQALTTPKK
jgi:hypothetical protein